jgi:MacB-like periplasmic core domain
MMGTLAQDLRFGFRTLTRNPVFALVSVLALAIGIGANTAIFSVIDAVLLRPLPCHESNRLVKIWEKKRPELTRGNVSFADFKDWKDQNHVFEGVAAYQTVDDNLTGVDEPEQVQGVAVSGNLFTLLGSRHALFASDWASQGRSKRRAGESGDGRNRWPSGTTISGR